MNQKHPMKAMMGREIREHARVTLLGMVLLALLLGVQFFQLLNPQGFVGEQPLLKREHQALVLGSCAVFGTLLGWLQARSERRRDLWAFLMHRPITRTRIFLSKLLAGIVLYTVAMGGPMLGYVLWIRFGGRVAAPFEWAMLLPWVASLMAGMGCLAAGMVFAIRRARWLGSRTLILAAGVPMVLCVLVPEFWMAVLIWLLFAGAMGIAAWGTYVGLGEDSDLPLVGKVGMMVSFLYGSLVPVILFMSGLMVTYQVLKPFIGGSNDDWTYETHTVSTDGTPYIMVVSSGKAPEYLHIDRTPVVASGSNSRRVDIAPSLMGSIGRTVQYKSVGYWDYQRYYFPISFPNGTGNWYWTRQGELVGYDSTTGLAKGRLKPAQPGERFKLPAPTFHPPPSNAQRYLSSETAVYRMESELEGPSEVYRSSESDPIVSALDVPVIRVGGQVENALVVLSERGVCMIGSEGEKIWEVPLELDEFDPGRIEFFSLADERTALLIYGLMQRQYPNLEPVVPERLIVISHASGTAHQTELGSRIASGSNRPGWQASIVEAMNGVFVFPVNDPKPYSWFKPNPWVVLWMGWGWLAGRRQGLSMPKQVGWAVFHLATGLPGLLASLSIGNWPTMIPCHKCGRSHALEETNCRSCGAARSLPEPDGTEIFEPA